MALLFNPLAMTPALDDNGAVMSGAKLFSYLAGTTTETATYTTSILDVANANPVIADASGRFGPIYVDEDIAYKFVLKDADDNTIETIDPFNPLASEPRTISVSLLDGVAVTGSPAITAAGVEAAHKLYGPAFDGSSSEVWAAMFLPSWPAGTITGITLYYAHADAASSDSIHFNIILVSTDIAGGIAETADTIVIADAADAVESASITLAVSINGGGEPLALHLERLPANANDTFANDIVVVGATLTFEPS